MKLVTFDDLGYLTLKAQSFYHSLQAPTRLGSPSPTWIGS